MQGEGFGEALGSGKGDSRRYSQRKRKIKRVRTGNVNNLNGEYKTECSPDGMNIF